MSTKVELLKQSGKKLQGVFFGIVWFCHVCVGGPERTVTEADPSSPGLFARALPRGGRSPPGSSLLGPAPEGVTMKVKYSHTYEQHGH